MLTSVLAALLHFWFGSTTPKEKVKLQSVMQLAERVICSNPYLNNKGKKKEDKAGPIPSHPV